MRGLLSRVEFAPGFWLFLGVLCVWLPLSQIACLLGTAVIHEAGHLLAARLWGGAFRGLRLGFFGWELDLGREGLSYRRQIPVDLAGPLANALACGVALFFIREHATREGLFFFFCNALYGALQLLPVPSLDGGRALGAALSLFLSRETAERAVRMTGLLAGGAALAAGIWVFRKTGNPSLALFCPASSLSGRGGRR